MRLKLDMATAEQHRRYLAIGHIAFFLFSLLAMIFGIWFLFNVWGVDEFLFVGMLFFGTLNLLILALSLIAGWALLNSRRWAKNASLIAALASAFHLPLGPFLCGYSFWFYFHERA